MVRGIFNRHRFAAMFFDDLSNLLLGFCREAFGSQCGFVADLQQVIHPPKFFQVTLIQNGNTVANVLDVGQQMGAHDNGFAFVTKLQNHVLHLPGPERVESGSGFIQQDQFRVVDQGRSQADSTCHSFGVFFQLAPLGVAKADLFNQLFGSLLANLGGHVKQPPVKIECFFGGQVLI